MGVGVDPRRPSREIYGVARPSACRSRSASLARGPQVCFPYLNGLYQHYWYNLTNKSALWVTLPRIQAMNQHQLSLFSPSTMANASKNKWLLASTLMITNTFPLHLQYRWVLSILITGQKFWKLSMDMPKDHNRNGTGSYFSKAVFKMPDDNLTQVFSTKCLHVWR